MNNVAILVVSCDAYQDLWHPFFHCFFKFWPDCPFKVYLGSNNATYADNRVIPLQIGEDIDYSSNLLAMLDAIPEERVILWIEDRILAAPVDTKRIMRLFDQAIQDDVVYLKLIRSHPFTFTDKQEQFGDIPAGNKYRVGITVALWKKSYLQKLVVPGESAWDLERTGSIRTTQFEPSRFCALSYHTRKQPPITDMHLIIKGKLLRDAIPFLVEENLMPFLKKRGVQTLGCYLYVKLYIALRDCQAVLMNAAKIFTNKSEPPVT